MTSPHSAIPILPELVEGATRPSTSSLRHPSGSPAGKKIVFFGNERLSTGLASINPQVLPALVNSGFNVLAVVSSNQPSGRSARIFEVESFAKNHGIPVLSSHNPLDILNDLRNLEPDLGVLVAYGHIVPQELLDLFPLGIINLHPSLLPLYRGSTPIEQTILDGTHQTGVSIMRLAKTMDAGPILAQKPYTLNGNEQKKYLAEQLLLLGTDMIMALLKDINSNMNKFSIQDEKRATYTPQIRKADGLVDWNKPAEQLEREVRAYQGWPGSFTTLAGKDIIITAAHVESQQGTAGMPFRYNKQLAVYTGQNALVIDKLKPAGKREMTGQEFLAGNKIL